MQIKYITNVLYLIMVVIPVLNFAMQNAFHDPYYQHMSAGYDSLSDPGSDIPPLPLYIFYTPSHEELKNSWFLPSIQDYFIIHEKQYQQECPRAQWMSTGWTKTTRHKIELVLDAIEEQWGGIFLYADVDIQFFAPVTHLVLQALKNKDIVFQQDDENGTICTGFFACRANEKTRALFQDVYKLMCSSELRSDQPTVNFCLRNRSCQYEIEWAYLPDIFFSGGRAKTQSKTNFDIPENIVMHHANGVVGIKNKIAQLQYVKQKVKAIT